MGFNLSKKDIIKEIVRSGKDPEYFINNYCRISHPMHGLIPFKTYPYQNDLINDFNDFRFTVILKARQLGISTISAAYAVWFMLFHRDKNILVIATKFQTASNLYPTLSTGGRCIALSTPNGVGNWFHKTYVSADNGDSDFKPVNLSWEVHPDRDEAWFKKETKNMSRRQIAQELECNFNTSGDTVIHPNDIAWLQEQIVEPTYRTGYDRNFWIWEKHEEGNSYLLVADVARGDGADNSVFHVLNVNTMEIVAEYQGKPSLDMYSQILYSAGMEYGKCLLVVENNGIGISVFEKLVTLGYENLYYSIKGSHEFVDAASGQFMTNAVGGFTTSTKTRPLIVAKLEEFIRNKVIKIRSSRAFDEFRTFVWNNGKPQAMRSYHDDIIMCLAITCWVRDVYEK